MSDKDNKKGVVEPASKPSTTGAVSEPSIKPCSFPGHRTPPPPPSSKK